MSLFAENTVGIALLPAPFSYLSLWILSNKHAFFTPVCLQCFCCTRALSPHPSVVSGPAGCKTPERTAESILAPVYCFNFTTYSAIHCHCPPSTEPCTHLQGVFHFSAHSFCLVPSDPPFLCLQNYCHSVRLNFKPIWNYSSDPYWAIPRFVSVFIHMFDSLTRPQAGGTHRLWVIRLCLLHNAWHVVTKYLVTG